jgi:phosphoglycerate dehydrogenase-like enzyme
LPDDSPLWTLENVIVTPHISGDLKDYPERVTEIFSENLLLWKAGKPLTRVVDLARGY